MKVKIGLTIFLLTGWLLCNCKKEGVKEEIDENNVIFSGISRTNNFGVVLSADTTDWKFNDIWKPQESSLFTSNHQSDCKMAFNYRLTSFPNPAKDIVTLNPSLPVSARIELRVVDQNFNKLFSLDSLRGPIQIRVSEWGIKGIVRVYYKFIDNNCEFKGHGDILLE